MTTRNTTNERDLVDSHLEASRSPDDGFTEVHLVHTPSGDSIDYFVLNRKETAALVRQLIDVLGA